MCIRDSLGGLSALAALVHLPLEARTSARRMLAICVRRPRSSLRDPHKPRRGPRAAQREACNQQRADISARFGPVSMPRKKVGH
eukprot:2119831-Alexandrium_andersonii.AAC.1